MIWAPINASQMINDKPKVTPVGPGQNVMTHTNRGDGFNDLAACVI